jgi:hypothetical protein
MTISASTLTDSLGLAATLERTRRTSAMIPSLGRKLENLTGLRPTLLTEPPAQHGPTWTCPRTGITIPKSFDANLKWRQRIIREASMSEELQGQLRAACRISAHVWFNLFAYTFRPKYVGPDGKTVQAQGHAAVVPFVTWKIQDEFIVELVDAIDTAHDAHIDKSRDMGASWLCLGVFHWFWQFRENMSLMELSRKEEYVDRKGEMDSLFEKHRFLHKWQPAWIRPRRFKDNYMLLGNGDTGSVLIGESTNGDAGRGGRKHAVLLDEFAAVEGAAKILAATADNTGCRIFNSTPAGPHTEFAKIKKEKRARLLELPWWFHPEKGRGAYQIYNEKGKPKWVSPWYFEEEKRRSKKEMAQELDMDHGKAGDVFFDEDEIERHRRAHAKAPLLVGAIELADDYGPEAMRRIVRRMHSDSVAFVAGTGDLRLWIPLMDNGRPPQDLTYAFGVDISLGSGDSNSVISVGAVELGMKVAEFASSRVSPERLAEIAAWMGVWFGGKRPPFINFEVNGPGGIFGRKLIKELSWPFYYTQRVEGTAKEQQTEQFGWHNNKQRKLVTAARYRTAIEKCQLINPSNESLDETLQYVIDETGALIQGGIKDLTTGARETHGDRVIADMVLWLAMLEAPKRREEAGRPPEGSPAWRREQSLKAQQREGEWTP